MLGAAKMRIGADRDGPGTCGKECGPESSGGKMSPVPKAGPADGLRLREKLYAPLKIFSVVRTLTDSGVDAKSLLAGSGLAQKDVSNAHARTSVHQFLTVCRNAAKHSPDPNWAVQVGSRMHQTDYGMYGYALVCAESLRSTCELAIRYHDLATPVMRIELVENGQRATWLLPALKDTNLLDVAEPLYRTLLEMQIGIHATLTKDVMGAWCRPARVDFALPRPRHAAALKRILKCPVQFDQAHTALHYPIDWLDRKPQFANPITATQVSATCAKLLEEQKWESGITRRVYAELMRTPGRFPSIHEIAETLCMSARTVRRKLDTEGTSYHSLLDSVRHALAVDYLSTSLLQIDDIAAALGFSDSASFRHAFKRWTGRTPGQYRSR
jgi:AraC-like DNA-binding protein